MAYIGDILVKAKETVDSDNRILNLQKIKEYRSPEVGGEAYEKNVEIDIDETRKSLLKQLNETLSKNLGIKSAYITIRDKVVIQPNRGFDVHRLAKLQDRFAAWEELGYKVNISYHLHDVPNLEKRIGDGETYYRVMVTPKDIYESVEDFEDNDQYDEYWKNSIIAESDGNLVFPVESLESSQEREIIDVLALELFDLPFAAS